MTAKTTLTPSDARRLLAIFVAFTTGFLLAVAAQVWFWLRPSRAVWWVEVLGAVMAVSAAVGYWRLSRRLAR